MSYSSYNHDDLEPASTMRIERRTYFESGKADPSEAVKLPLTELLSLRARSAATEQKVSDRLKAQATAWEKQTGRILLLDKVLEYARTLPVTYTSSQREQPDSYRHIRSNMVYQMYYSISESTRYDSIAQTSAPHSWTLSWDLRTNASGSYQQAGIAGQDRKASANREALDKYLNSRIKTYAHYFMETSLAIPKEYADYFKISGCLLLDYTIEGEELAKAVKFPTQKEPIQPPTFNITPERRASVNEVYSIFLDNHVEAQSDEPHGCWLSLPATAGQMQAVLNGVHVTADNQQDCSIAGVSAPEGHPLELPEDLIQSTGVDELSFLAVQLQKLDAVERLQLNVVMQSLEKSQAIGQIISYSENTDCSVLIGIKDCCTLGDHYLNHLGLMVIPDERELTIDAERLDQFTTQGEQGTFAKYGYPLRTGDRWQRVYESQPVPEGYRAMAYPAPGIIREESKVRPETAVPAKAPQSVTPTLLSNQSSTDYTREVTDRLGVGIQELSESKCYKAYPAPMMKSHSYSLSNALLITMQGGQLATGYNRWRDELHHNVKKSEKVVGILAPAPFKAKEEVPKLDAQGKVVIDQDGKSVTEVQETQAPALKTVSVFDISQTEGEPLPSTGMEELTDNVERYEEFSRALERTPPALTPSEDIPGGSRGYYHLAEQRIVIQKGMSESQILKTAIYEVACPELHAINPEALAIEQANRPDSCTREAQTENVAYAVYQHYGLDTSGYSFDYVAGWSPGKDLKELKASFETIRAITYELVTTIDGYLTQFQKERQAQQEQPQTVPLEQAAEQSDSGSAFSELPPKQQQEVTDNVKAVLQTLIEADLKSTGRVLQGTKGVTQEQGFTIVGDGPPEKAKAPQEATHRLESDDYLYIQTSENGYDYTLYGPDCRELGGGQPDNPDLSLMGARKEILTAHELPVGTMEPLTGDVLDGFPEAVKQANTIPQSRVWSGIDGILSGNPLIPDVSPADRAIALIALAEQGAPCLGREEWKLIMDYVDAVNDPQKIIGLINHLCEQGYELQHSKMDDVVKNQVVSEMTAAKVEQTIACDPEAEPIVTIFWSESLHLRNGQQMSLHGADAVSQLLDEVQRRDRERLGYTGSQYDEIRFRIDFTIQGQPDNYEGRQDFGDGDSSLIQHIWGCHEYCEQDEGWRNRMLHYEGPEAWETDKAQRDMLLHTFVPYLKQHCNLSCIEQKAQHLLRFGDPLLPEQTAYLDASVEYIREYRPLLNQEESLSESPQLFDFDKSLQDYEAQVKTEPEQKVATARLTVEEYIDSGPYAPAQPNFPIYQVLSGLEGCDFHYRSYEDLQADGLLVNRENYQLAYAAPLGKDTTLGEIHHRFNMEHPTDYKGRSLSMGDIVAFRQDGEQMAYHVDEKADHRQVPGFFSQPEKQLMSGECMTGGRIQTPRGRFYLTDRSRGQMEAAGYEFHHQSEDGKYLTVVNGIRAFAIPAQQDSHIKTAEMSTEQNYNMIDGMMNNAPSMEELEAKAKAEKQVSLLNVAEVAKAETKKPKQAHRTIQKPKKPFIRAQPAAAKEEQKRRSLAWEKPKETEV